MPQINEIASVSFVSQQGQYAHLINNELGSLKFYTLADYDRVFAALRELSSQLCTIKDIEKDYAEFLSNVAPKAPDDTDVTGLAKLLDPELCYIYPTHVSEFRSLMQNLITYFMQHRTSETQRIEHLYKPTTSKATPVPTLKPKQDGPESQFKAQRDSLLIRLNAYYICMGDKEVNLLLRSDLATFVSNPEFTYNEVTSERLDIDLREDRIKIVETLKDAYVYMSGLSKSSLYRTREFDTCIKIYELLSQDEFTPESKQELDNLLTHEFTDLGSIFKLFGDRTPELTEENKLKLQDYTLGIRNLFIYTNYTLQELLEMDIATRRYLLKDKAGILFNIEMDLIDRKDINIYVAWHRLHSDSCDAEKQLPEQEQEQPVPSELHTRYLALLDQMQIAFYSVALLSDLKNATQWMCDILANLQIFYNIPLDHFKNMPIDTAQLAATWHDESLNTYMIRHLTANIGCDALTLLKLPEQLFKQLGKELDDIMRCCQEAGIELKQVMLRSVEEIELLLDRKNLQRLKIALGYYCLPADEFMSLALKDKRALLAKPSLARKLFDETAAANEYSLMLGLVLIKGRLNEILGNLEHNETLCNLKDLHELNPDLMRILQAHAVPFYKAHVIVQAFYMVNVQATEIYTNRFAYTTHADAKRRCTHDDSQVQQFLEPDEAMMVNTTINEYATKLNIILFNTYRVKRSAEFQSIFDSLDFLNTSSRTEDAYHQMLCEHIHEFCIRIQHMCKSLNYGNARLKHLHLLNEILNCKVADHFSSSEHALSQDVTVWKARLDSLSNTDYPTYFPRTENASEHQSMFERFFHAVLCLRNTLLHRFSCQLFKPIDIEAENDYFRAQNNEIEDLSKFTLAYRTKYFITPSCTEYSPYAFACQVPSMQGARENIARMIRRDTSRMLINFYRVHGLSFNNDYPNMFARDKYGNTALHIAILEDNKLIALALILRGCDIGAKGADDLTPMQLALRENQVQIIHDIQAAHTAQELRQICDHSGSAIISASR